MTVIRPILTNKPIFSAGGFLTVVYTRLRIALDIAFRNLLNHGTTGVGVLDELRIRSARVIAIMAYYVSLAPTELSTTMRLVVNSALHSFPLSGRTDQTSSGTCRPVYYPNVSPSIASRMMKILDPYALDIWRVRKVDTHSR